jgi:hypothetical protein
MFLVAGTVGLVMATGCGEDGMTGTNGDAENVPPAFASAASCGGCHPEQLAEWETSRHAYSSADPVMHRLAEIAGAEIKEVCKECHAPAQQRMERLLAIGKGDPSVDLSKDGTNCDVCHSISDIPPVATAAFIGHIDPTGPKYANMPQVIETSAHASERREWYGTSIACASCHQFDLADGTNLENTFIEWEATNLAGMGFQCQSCHMPLYDGRAAEGGPWREGLHRHRMVGVDYAYEEFRGINLEQQKEDVRQLLENSVSVTTSVPTSVTAGSTLTFDITVLNDKTGHSIPSGVSFAREMWISVRVTDGGDAVVYESGQLASNDDLIHDADITTFSAQMYDAAGAPTGFAWLAASIDEAGLLKYLESRTATYEFSAPDQSGQLTMELALRFRSLAPGGLRDLGLDRILPIEVFDMWTETVQVTVL